MDHSIPIGVYNLMRYYTIHTLYLVLLAFTLSSYLLGELVNGGVWAMLFLLFTAVIKGSLIIRDFMGLNGVSLLWRVIMYGWLWGVCFILSIIYIMGL